MNSHAIAMSLAALLATACATEPAAPAADPHAEHAAADPHAGHAAADPHAGHAGHAGSGDLKSIMVTLGTDMGEVHTALWIDDHAALQAAARAIADHPHVAPDEMKRIQGVLGAEFADFAKADKRVHDAAVRLADAAAAADIDAELRELSAVQSGCVACHTAFRDRLTATP